MIERVLQKCEDDADLKEFIAMRVVPMFKKRWSLTQIIRDLRKRYGEMIAVEFLDPVMIQRLRGKETHGSSGRYTGEELAFMGHATRLLILLYVLLVLERCGIARDCLLRGLSAARSDYFSKAHLKRMLEDISSHVDTDATEAQGNDEACG